MYGNKVQLQQLEDPGKDPFGGESWIDLSPKDWIRRRPKRKWVGIFDLFSMSALTQFVYPVSNSLLEREIQTHVILDGK